MNTLTFDKAAGCFNHAFDGKVKSEIKKFIARAKELGHKVTCRGGWIDITTPNGEEYNTTTWEVSHMSAKEKEDYLTDLLEPMEEEDDD